MVLKAAKNKSINMLANNNLEKEPIKFKVDPICEEMAFNDGNKLSLDGGEVRTQKVSLSKSDLYKEVSDYVDEDLVNSEKVDLIKGEMTVEPVVMDDALSEDGEETIVAYSVSFPHIYDGYAVEDDKLVAIVDGEGVKYTAVNWSGIQEKEVKFETKR